MKAVATALVTLAVGWSAATASAADPPYNIPTGPSAQNPPSLPLVAALSMPRGQRLGRVLRKGLVLRVYAYRQISLVVSAALTPATAKRYHVRRKGAIPRRDLEFKTPGVYEVHV